MYVISENTLVKILTINQFINIYNSREYIN